MRQTRSQSRTEIKEPVLPSPHDPPEVLKNSDVNLTSHGVDHPHPPEPPLSNLSLYYEESQADSHDIPIEWNDDYQNPLRAFLNRTSLYKTTLVTYQ